MNTRKLSKPVHHPKAKFKTKKNRVTRILIEAFTITIPVKTMSRMKINNHYPSMQINEKMIHEKRNRTANM